MAEPRYFLSPETVWRRQEAFSNETFGPSSFCGPIASLKHLITEAGEALKAPGDVVEYADCLLLVFDAARRAGFSIAELFDAALYKIEVNKLREWPDWRTADPTEPVQHTLPMMRDEPAPEGAPK
jgi:dATP/dGTP pyrophosphohydrolase